MIHEIHSEKDLDTYIADAKGYVLLDLWAAWCRPCQVMAPAFQAVEEHFAGKVSLVRMEVDEMEELVEPFRIQGIPTFILYKDGEEKGRIIGYRMKSKFLEEVGALVAGD